MAELYAGYYQGDGKPFVAHGVGVASIVAGLGQPAPIVAVALLHAVYANADFGDGAGAGATPARRRVVQAAVGAPVEELVFRFTQVRIQPDTIERERIRMVELDATTRAFQLVAVADHLEKYVDLGVHYFGDNREIVEWTERIGTDLVAIAAELGETSLARTLETAFAEADAQADGVPPELRPADRRRHLKLVVPRSCRRRLAPRLRQSAVALAARARALR